MTRSHWIILAIFSVCALPVAAQKSGCEMVTQSEASAILGSPVEKQAFSTVCIYKVKGSTISLVVRNTKTISAGVSATKANFTKSGGTVKDEPALGPGAYSAVRPDSSRIYVFKKDQTLMINFEDTSKAKAPDGMMDKLRAAASKALGRF